MPSLADYDVSQATPAAAQTGAQQDNGGFSLFGWHPSLPNLGGITALKQLASGFIGIPEQIAAVGGDIAAGNWGDLNPLNGSGTVGRFAGGIGMGVENLATSVAGAVGIPGTRYNLGDEVLAPVLQKLNEMGPQMTDQAGNTIDFKPSTFWTRPGGPIAGAVMDVATGALIAAPIASALGSTAAAAGAASDAAATAVADGTGTAEAATAAAENAARAARAAEIAHNFAHPYQYLGARAADIVLGAREATLPPISETPGTTPTAPEILNAEQAAPKPEPVPSNFDLGQVGQILRDLHDPQKAAAQTATRSSAEDALLAQHPGEPTTTLYQGRAEGANPDNPWYTTNPERAAKYGELHKVEVPQSVLDETAAAAEKARELPPEQGGGQPTAGDHWLGPEHQDWADAVTKVPPPGEPNLNLPTHPGEVRPEAIRAEQAQQIAQAVEEAKANARESSVATTVAKRIAETPPAWAQALTRAMPDSINNVLAKFATPITNARFRAVARDYMRIAETAQRGAINSPAVIAMRDAAAQVVEAVPNATRFDITHYVGEDVASLATGEKIVESFVKTGGRADLTDALRQQARNGYGGLPQEIRDAMTPEQHTAYDAAIVQAAEKMHDVAAQHQAALLASRPGALGIESAVLQDESPFLTPAETKLYRRAMSELRQKMLMEQRIPDAEMQRVAAAERQRLLADGASAEADKAAAQVGVLERAAKDLKEPVPLALRAENIEGAIDALVGGAMEGGTVIHDVGRNVSVLPPDGVLVTIAPQFDIPISADPNFIPQLREMVRNALEHPVNADGTPYGPGLWAGSDARMITTVHTGPDGAQWISGNIGMSTWGGKALPRWLAVGLGEMHRMDAGVDLATGMPVRFSGITDVQNLWAHYGNMAIDPKSAFARFATKLAADAEQIQNLPPEEVDAALRYYMTLDYSLSRSNPNDFKLGDYFAQATTDVGKGRPASPALLQTVLNLSAKDAWDLAHLKLEHEQVQAALKWYYDSHDYIEKMWRYNKDGSVKMIRLLDGSERPAAEVFYDLLAVTSVMADPKTNLGRALMSMSNMKEFIGQRTSVMTSVKKMMNELEKIPATDKLPLGNTELSARFVSSPEIRRLTMGSSMTNQPKYNVFDILAGRLNLETATNEQIAHQPEWWTGKVKSTSEAKMSRQQVIRMMDTQGVTGPAADAYRAWDARMTQLERTVPFKQVDAEKFANFVDEASNNERGGVSTSEMLTPRTVEEWKQGGFRMFMSPDGKTGYALAPDGDLTGVINNGGVPGAGSAAVQHAISQGAKTLDAFELPTEGMPGGLPGFYARHGFQESWRSPWNDEMAGRTGLSTGARPDVVGMELPEGTKGEGYSTQASLTREIARTKLQGQELFKEYPDLKAAHEQAVAEHHGSNLIWKMRAFRDNLANPHTSLAVTLDSVMAQVFGMHENEWSGGNRMGMRSDEVRTLAQEKGVAPHSVQALLWIVGKLETGRQDWGRLLYHHDIAQGILDDMEKAIHEGRPINPRAFDPLGDYFQQELGYTHEVRPLIAERKALLAREKAGSITPEEQARLNEVRNANYRSPVRTTDVMTAANRAEVGERPNEADAYQWETRHEIPWDAGKQKQQEKRMNNYYDVRNEIVNSLQDGDVPTARRLLTSYVNSQKDSVLGDVGGSFGDVGPEMLAKEGNATSIATGRLNEGYSRSVPRPNDVTRMTLSELHQKFGDQIRGATLLNPDKTGRLTMRLFQNAALDTLVHEGGHLLRQILPHEDFAQVLAHYPHILDATLTPERVAAEEQFVSDLMLYMRKAVVQGDHTGPMAGVFEKVGATLEEQHAAMLDGPYGRTLNNDIHGFFSRLFHPNIDTPDKVIDPLSVRSVVAPANAETRRFRWETDAQFAQRTRQYGEARAKLEAAQMQAALKARVAAKADAATRRMYAVILNTPTDVQLEAQRLGVHAYAIIDKLGRSLDNLDTIALHRIPREWQPMVAGFNSLRAAAKEHPELLEYMDEIPSTFSAVVQAAGARGFVPAYMPEMTWEQANRLLFGHLQVGKFTADQEVVAGSRKANQGVLRANSLGDRSMQALAAGAMDATHELYSNKVIDFIENNWRQPFTSGAQVPKGWEPWDPHRTWILTGTVPTGERIAMAGGIIPSEVARALKSMSQRYDHWLFHTVSKVTKPWITYNLTLSPKWYLHIFVSNVVRSLAEGTTLADWRTAIRQWKTGTLPEEVYGHSIAGMVGTEKTLIGKTINEARQSEGMLQALSEVRQRVAKIHDVMDEVSRGAVFEKTLRTTGSREMALTRAYQAMVDYGDLSPLERGAVRALIPFYPFYKGMVKLLARFPADHPAATALLLVSGKMHDEYLQDKFGGKLPDAYRGYANIGGLHNFTILDPFLNPTHLVDIHNVNQTLNPFVDILLRDAYNAAERGTGTPGMDATGHPVTQVNLAKALGNTLAGANVSRLGATLATGGDVYGKQQGIAGALGSFLGAPSTPNVSNIQAAVGKSEKAAGQPVTAGPNAPGAPPLTADQLQQAIDKALAKQPGKPRAKASASSKAVRSAVARIRGPKAHHAGAARVRAPRVRTVRAKAAPRHGGGRHH